MGKAWAIPLLFTIAAGLESEKISDSEEDASSMTTVMWVSGRRTRLAHLDVRFPMPNNKSPTQLSKDGVKIHQIGRGQKSTCKNYSAKRLRC